MTALRASEPRRARNIPSQDLNYDDAQSKYSPVPVPMAPSGSQRRHSPISSRPPSLLDTPTDIDPSPWLRQPLQPSSVTVRPRGVRTSPTSTVLETSDMPLIQLKSASRLSVSTALSEMPNSTDHGSPSASRASLEEPSSATSVNPSPSAVFASSDHRHSPSPAPSSHSKTKGKLQSQMPSVTPEQAQLRRDQNVRISFFDPANQSALDRLIFRGFGTSDTEGEEESTQGIMANVEEMLEGYEWASDDILGRTRSRGAVDQIAARLLDELMASEKVY
jgi:exocyst complex component 1